MLLDFCSSHKKIKIKIKSITKYSVDYQNYERLPEELWSIESSGWGVSVVVPFCVKISIDMLSHYITPLIMTVMSRANCHLEMCWMNNRDIVLGLSSYFVSKKLDDTLNNFWEKKEKIGKERKKLDMVNDVLTSLVKVDFHGRNWRTVKVIGCA